MNRKLPALSATPAHPLPRILRLVLVAGLLCLLATFTIAAGAAPTARADGPGGDVSNPTIRAVDIAEPAVVRIITTLGGQLTVQFSSGNVTFPTNGSSYPIQLSGTGTFISAHGDILTADHVVNPPHDASLGQALQETATPDVTNYINQHAKAGSPQVSQSQVFNELQSGQLSSQTAYGSASSQVFLNTSYTGPLSAPNFSSLPSQIYATVDRIEGQSSFQNEDVAIIHVPMNDMPSVQLGDSSGVQQQDQLTIIGFPGNGDVSNLPTDLLTASVNQVEVSSIKTTDTGAPVIQVGGNVEHGDSGGPALDSTGQVVGIVSFGLASDGTSGETSFLQASNSARTLVQSLNLNTSPGPFQQAWNQAVNDYASTAPGHWHKAAQEFSQLAAKYPLFKGVQPYLTYVQTQAKTEKVPATKTTQPAAHSSSIMAYVWTIVGIAILAALLVLLFGTLSWSRRRQKQRQQTAADRPAVAPGVQANGNNGAFAPARGPGGAPPNQAPAAGQGWRAPAAAAPPDSTMQNALSAFGAPPTMTTQSSPLSIVSGTLLPWPCGHLNRPNARYCSVCGEPAPEPPTIRKFEQ
jgi:serine protease Do